MKNKGKIVVSFSGGRTSAYMLKRLIDDGEDLIVTFANTGKERNETLDFVRDCELNWGIKIIWLEYRNGKNFDSYEIVNYETASRNGEPFEQLIFKVGHLPNAVYRWCTSRLKIDVIKHYINDLYSYDVPKDLRLAIGIRADERHRGKSKGTNLPSIFPLLDAEIVKEDVDRYWREQSFDLAIDSRYGNCDMCFLKSKSKLVDIIKNTPESADWWIDLEDITGETFVRERSFRTLVELSKHPVLFEVENGGGVSCFCTD